MPRRRSRAGALLAVLAAAAGASSCSDPSLAELVDQHATSEYHSKLADPSITTAKTDRQLDLCTVLTPDEVTAALGRSPDKPARQMFGGCAWEVPTRYPDLRNAVRTSIAGLDSRGKPTTVRGNSALVRRTSIGCEVTVALAEPDDPDRSTVDELAVNVDALDDPHATPCPAATELAGRAFDRLPAAAPGGHR